MTLSQKNTPLLKKAGVFTLIEILVAITIMAIGLGTVFFYAGSSGSQLDRARKMWAWQHQMNNACEYYLLAGHNANLPTDLLASEYRATCDFEIYDAPPEESTPDEAPQFAFENDYKGWHLGVYTITLYGEGGNILGEQKIEKIVRDED